MNELSYYIGAAAPFFILSAIISKNGNLTLARFIYLIIFNLSVALTASFVGKAGSAEFILMFSMGLPFVWFSFRREKLLIVFFSGLSLIFWSLLYFTDFNLFTDTHMDVVRAGRYIYPISIITTICLVTFQLIYFSFIRTPLNAITGLSYILGDTDPRDDQKQNIEALNYSGKILMNLLNNVLDFSKMESTKIELDPIPTNIMAAVRQIKKIHEPSCLRKGVAMELEIDEELPNVWLDIVRFNQVINNLVTNAIKFTDNGSVTLKIVKQGETDDKVLIGTEIIDTGIGIPEEQQETIWQAFTQASSSTNRLYGGTGLGLPIVKSIVEAMGSKVHVDSKMGSGSRVYFDLELKLASTQELEKITQKKHYDLKGKNILLVEDNLINVMVAKQILEKANLIVDVAYDGQMAVNKVRKNKYNALLMDIQMPVMDGYTATKEIRKFNSTLPILALSASVFLEVRNKILESGMDGFIFKPFDPEDLLNKIEEVMDK